MSHCYTIVDSYCIEFRSEASQLLNLCLHQLTDFMQMHMSRNKLGERIDDSDNGFTHLILLHAVGCPQCTGSRHPTALCTKRTA